MKLLVAELRKQLGLAFARSMLAVVLLGGAVVILVMAALDVGAVIPTRHHFGWPAAVELWAGLLMLFLFFVPLTVTAWGTGLEQSHDTWKMVLTRHSPRRDLLFAKLAVAAFWLVALLALSFVMWGGLAAALGFLLPPESPREIVDPRNESFEVLGLVLRTISLLPAVMLVTLLARSNGTLVGTLAGIVGPMAVSLTKLWAWTALNRATPIVAADALALRLRGDAIAAGQADELVGASWGPVACMLVLVAWFVVPMIIAVWQFERRDLVSETG